MSSPGFPGRRLGSSYLQLAAEADGSEVRHLQLSLARTLPNNTFLVNHPVRSLQLKDSDCRKFPPLSEMAQDRCLDSPEDALCSFSLTLCPLPK